MFFKDLNKASAAYGKVENVFTNSDLPNEIETVVIGGGLLGLSTAITLAEGGRDVAVFEMGKIGDGPSGRSGGQLWPGYEMPLTEMKQKYGLSLARKAWDLTDDALGLIHTRLARRSDCCDFMPGLMATSKTKTQARWLEEEALCFKEAALNFASYVSGEDLKKKYINTDSYYNGILFAGDVGRQYGHLNPFKFTHTVAQLAADAGVRLFEHAIVNRVSPMGDLRHLISSSRGDIVAKNVVFATGADFIRPMGVGFDVVRRNFVPAQTVILATEPISEALAVEMIPGKVCFADCGERNMNYVALIPDTTLGGHYRLTFGGANALMQIEMAAELLILEREMRAMFPQLNREKIKVDKIWGGNCDTSRTFLPAIYSNGKGVYGADGFSGHGMVNTTLYGTAIAEKIMGRDGEKFETLEKLTPPAYSNNFLIAWLQAAKIAMLKS